MFHLHHACGGGRNSFYFEDSGLREVLEYFPCLLARKQWHWDLILRGLPPTSDFALPRVAGKETDEAFSEVVFSGGELEVISRQ